ncbi:MAG: hypothetical protein GEU95_06480 [Rhizobiales bacterium]|nr:hypothetical protein [Hyphomicrobiales bacterium]
MKKRLIYHATGNHRTRRLVTALAVLVLSAFAFSQAASAQASPPPGTQPSMQPKSQAESDPRLKAPIGHRQPRPSDLPPSIQRDETQGRATPDERALDRKLKICKQC